MKNPHDAGFKDLAEGQPELLLRLFKLWQPGMEAELIDLLRELRLDPVHIDHAYRIGRGTDAYIIHLEAISTWDEERTGRLALYRFLLRQKYKLPVRSFLVFMSEERARRKPIPGVVTYSDGDGTTITTPYESIRMWELDPSLAFEPGCAALLQWVPLLRGGLAEFERAQDAVAELVAHPERVPPRCPSGEVLAIQLASAASLRYDRKVFARFVERIRAMTLTTDLFKDSWLYQDGEAAGMVKGEAVGLVKGEAVGLVKGEALGRRASIAKILGTRFPSVSASRLGAVTDLHILDDVLIAIADARDEAEAQAVLDRL